MHVTDINKEMQSTQFMQQQEIGQKRSDTSSHIQKLTSMCAQ